MDYAQKAMTALRTLPADAGIVLWQFPQEDFEAWRAMPDTPALDSYEKYLSVLAAMQGDIERRGKQARRVVIPVAAVIAELDRLGLENNSQNRSNIIKGLGAKQ